MSTLSDLIRKGRAAGLGVALAAVAAGCGTSTASQTATAANAPVSPVVSTNIAIPNDPDGPINVQIAIDRNAIIRGGRTLATQYAAAAEEAAEAPVTRGGTLTITAFGGVGVRPLPVFQATMPPLSQEGQIVRGGDEATWRAEIDAAISVAVGLAKANPTATAELASLTDVQGSDVARALAYQLETQPLDQNTPNVIEILTNALVQEHMLHLFAGLANGKPDAEMAALIAREASVRAGTPRAALVLIGPVGLTSGQSQLGPIMTHNLIASWTLALQSLPIDRFQVSATL